MNKILIVITSFIVCSNFIIYGQDFPKIINQGILSITKNDVISFDNTFENTENGEVVNDGEVYYYSHFRNDGFYGITTNQKTSNTFFVTEDKVNGVKNIYGEGLSNFYNINFDSPVLDFAFNLKNNIDIYGNANFKNGIIKVDSVLNNSQNLSYGMISFQQGATTSNTSDISYIDGQIEKIGKEKFRFPIGNKGQYRYAHISAPQNEKDIYIAQYIFGDNKFFRINSNKVGAIQELDTSGYWVINKGNKTTGDILLTLNWDDRSSFKDLLTNSKEELHIVRWDDKNKIWVDEGGIANQSVNEISTVTKINNFGYFTLAKIKKDWVLEGDVVIYNFVSTNEDGKNEYFVIDHINKYPNNTVEIFNRWGVKVFKTTNYDSNGDGSINVFNGYSDGKNQKLPSGTYYYIINYEYLYKGGSKMIKKVGYLHLEAN